MSRPTLSRISSSTSLGLRLLALPAAEHTEAGADRRVGQRGIAAWVLLGGGNNPWPGQKGCMYWQPQQRRRQRRRWQLTCQAELWQHGVLIKRRPSILLPARPPLLIPPLVRLLVAGRLGRPGCLLGFLGPGCVGVSIAVSVLCLAGLQREEDRRPRAAAVCVSRAGSPRLGLHRQPCM